MLDAFRVYSHARTSSGAGSDMRYCLLWSAVRLPNCDGTLPDSDVSSKSRSESAVRSLPKLANRVSQPILDESSVYVPRRVQNFLIMIKLKKKKWKNPIFFKTFHSFLSASSASEQVQMGPHGSEQKLSKNRQNYRTKIYLVIYWEMAFIRRPMVWRG